MLSLKADNRSLIKSSKSSFLSTNYVSGVSSLVIINSSGFNDNDYILIGEFGSETTEIMKIYSVNTSTHTLSLTSTTKFAHPQDTRISVLPYNQVRFYRTVNDTDRILPSGELPGSPMDIQPEDFYTIYYDTINTTGFGWFLFYNSTTDKVSSPSNAIPYGGFEEYSVKKIFDSFFSLLNNKELKLISNEDAFRWLNEGYSTMRNELNLVNQEYSVNSEYPLTTTSGTAEYELQSNFSDLVSVTDSEGNELDYIEIPDIRRNNSFSVSNNPGYYLRGNYIGITPTPTSSETYYLYFKSKSTSLSSYYDNIDLPNNNFYPLLDHMMYRAGQKTGRPNPETYELLFEKGIQRMKMVSFKQNENKDSWDIDQTSNV